MRTEVQSEGAPDRRIQEAVSRHPSSGVALAEAPSSERSPYRVFFDALEELSMVVSLHGTASIEAAEARAHVRNAREQAAELWRSGQTA